MRIESTDIRIGTAGWRIPPEERATTPGSALARYATQLDATEVNSCFYRHHMPSTYSRWAQSVPGDFRFAVKLPKSITHEARLDADASQPILERFVQEVSHFGTRRGPLLVQLAPSLAFDPARVAEFLAMLRERWDGEVVCEPRHATWFDAEADDLLRSHEVARVGADPELAPGGSEPGGWPGLAYLRLHGSPRTYWSSYEPEFLAATADRIRALADGPATTIWCIFDNTARGHGLPNALDLQRLLAPDAEPTPVDDAPRYRIISTR